MSDLRTALSEFKAEILEQILTREFGRAGAPRRTVSARLLQGTLRQVYRELRAELVASAARVGTGEPAAQDVVVPPDPAPAPPAHIRRAPTVRARRRRPRWRRLLARRAVLGLIVIVLVILLAVVLYR